MNDYEARKAAKAERYRTYAENAARRSAQAYRGGKELADSIPMGQPILVGHHSERRARRDAARIDGAMRRSVAESDKAAYWANRAAAVEADTSISRHDPDAAAKLQTKIVELEARQASMRRANRAARTGKIDGLSDEEAARVRAAGRLSVVPHEPYELSNLAANLRRYRARLAEFRGVAR